MKGYKEVLRKEHYQTRIYETLFIKLLEYCIEHKQTLPEVINDSLFEKLKIDKDMKAYINSLKVNIEILTEQYNKTLEG